MGRLRPRRTKSVWESEKQLLGCFNRVPPLLAAIPVTQEFKASEAEAKKYFLSTADSGVSYNT